MKIILSRKGFDSEYGGQPSPILPDGTLLSFPIPKENHIHKYNSFYYKEKTHYEIIKGLIPQTKIQQEETCHLDPDIRKSLMDRNFSWKGLFGQENAASGHLRKKGVDIGDLFLFFGWFKEAVITNNIYKYKLNFPELHVIFGYLQIGAKYTDMQNLPEYVKYHPHAKFISKNNIIFEASETLSLNNDLPGWGCLLFNKELQLTKDGEKNKSRWKLPDIFGEVNISYHSNAFNDEYFQSASIGQEFVIDENQNITEWAKNIIINNYEKESFNK